MVCTSFGLGLLGAYLVQAKGPYSLFLCQSIAGIITLCISLTMSSKVEIEGDFEAEALVHSDPSRSGIHLRRSFCQEVEHNWNVVRNAMKIRILRDIYLFYILLAVTFPQLWNFMYYFYRDEVGMSQV